ncbi:hypothetical protein J6I75_02885 [Pseudidiomarina sp. 1APP75-27a]|uniref:hypothetical protein n=1 Tax=Pseudidiomarina terrestris TaxID=2820060 RepID=UPI002B057AC7|nr:hypothetical protein [Pseudidiomarina sp. 1APP75-27a]MEA3587298.1 hypothetical protein [Pseudidiomarina sp. 1APP75-27a]
MNAEIVDRIIYGNTQLASFWKNSHGWAPQEAADLMSKSRLDWQVELSKTLKLWDFQEAEHGQLILAWANLGALVEGTLKLFLAVYYLDYVKDDENFKINGKVVEPDSLALEKLKQFFRKRELLNDVWFSYIDLVQQRRNAIHAFKDRPIGNKVELGESVGRYLDLMITINEMLPYPEKGYEPQF